MLAAPSLSPPSLSPSHSSSPIKGHKKKAAVYKPGRDLSPETESAGAGGLKTIRMLEMFVVEDELSSAVGKVIDLLEEFDCPI